ncbi:response regulator [Patescibacteria group bacterium]|nr:response regulator [Patescibacteria group bacterium]
MKSSVLIVEDNKDLADFYRIILEEQQYSVALVENLEDTLSHLKKNTCDLVLLDLLLEEDSGKDILKEIKRLFTIPVVIISNLPHERNECLSLGAVGFIVKSETEPEGILEVVKKFASKKCLE